MSKLRGNNVVEIPLWKIGMMELKYQNILNHIYPETNYKKSQIN